MSPAQKWLSVAITAIGDRRRSGHSTGTSGRITGTDESRSVVDGRRDYRRVRIARAGLPTATV
jgi:hypothetical protein